MAGVCQAEGHPEEEEIEAVVGRAAAEVGAAVRVQACARGQAEKLGAGGAAEQRPAGGPVREEERGQGREDSQERAAEAEEYRESEER